MFDPTIPQYDDHIELIKRLNKNGKSFLEIKDYGSESVLSEKFLVGELGSLVSTEQWCLLVDGVDAQYQKEQEEISTANASEDDATIGEEITADIRLSDSKGSSWMCYRNHLLKQKWYKGSVEMLGINAISTLKRMSRDTKNRELGSVKGLVVGHVQSGKTANIASLMSVGADNGWTFFIILSGTIESLRVQTSTRLFGDLNHPGNLNWSQLSRLGSNDEENHKLQNLHLNSHDRYFTVSLKIKSRLEKLLKWLESDKNKLAQMKLVIIDDEADQASINASLKDRTTINKLIIQLTEVRALAVNYVAYTATPYSCFLNEAFPESLYPSDFIKMLPQSYEHFGPKQVFGYEGASEGLDIIRTITKASKKGFIEDYEIIMKIHKETSLHLPDSLKDAISWFICCCAVRRAEGYKKPVSMLIHTSQKQIHHRNIANAVIDWLKNSKREVELYCESIYLYETNRFLSHDFSLQYPTYRIIDTIKDYPNYTEIVDEVSNVISEISHIYMERENNTVTFSQGINVCIDNSANTGINDDNEHIRLLYPNETHQINFSTAFIVIGGNTLSRGLTFEGLVSTYFLRNTCQADTLMQMGRWFGYRRGYELLPRIWMTEDTEEKFKFLTALEEELRDDLKAFHDDLRSPREFGPRVKNSPRSSWLKPTAVNKMQNAMAHEVDYSGLNIQTTLFNIDAIQNNLKVATDFLCDLDQPKTSIDKTSIYWDNISFEKIESFLTEMKFHQNSIVFSDLDPFYIWYRDVKKKADYSDWNIVLGSIKDDTYGKWEPLGTSRVKRTIKLRADRNSYSMKVMRAPKDLFADVPNNFPGRSSAMRNSLVNTNRKKYGYGNTPLLIVYNIAGELKEKDLEEKDYSEKENDLIGLSIWIPSIGKEQKGDSFVKSLTVRIPEDAIYDEE